MKEEGGVLLLGKDKLEFNVITDDELEEGKIIMNPKDLEKFDKGQSWTDEEIKEIDNINGIGKETLDDILKIYKNMSELKEALKEDKVPLRNDVCKKLKKAFG